MRAVDIPVEISTTPSRVYENLGAFPCEAALSEYISDAAQRDYGHAGPAFVRALLADLDRNTELASRLVDLFLELVVEDGDDGQVRRVAQRFAIVAAAGDLATRFGILPWSREAAFRAVIQCYTDWKVARGDTASEEERDALKTLAGFFEAHGASRFETIHGNGDGAVPSRLEDRPVHARCGYRLFQTGPDGEEHTVYYVLPEAWANHVCEGRDPTLVARTAREHGVLLLGENGRLQKKVRLPDYPGGTRVYAIRPDLLL